MFRPKLENRTTYNQSIKFLGDLAISTKGIQSTNFKFSMKIGSGKSIPQKILPRNHCHLILNLQ